MKKIIFILVTSIFVFNHAHSADLKIITKKEYIDSNTKRLEQEFDKVDTNKDGKATPEEQKAFTKKIVEARKVDEALGKLADTNKDGKISQEERQTILVAMDTDKNGNVSVEEQKNYLKKNSTKK
jgi:Ca2+-binding EF-hand superfamily protein|tara:strand:+ start:28 stop:402 length:375 start_codon:yes stop_codon:yes gene_type:complete